MGFGPICPLFGIIEQYLQISIETAISEESAHLSCQSEQQLGFKATKPHGLVPTPSGWHL